MMIYGLHLRTSLSESNSIGINVDASTKGSVKENSPIEKIDRKHYENISNDVDSGIDGDAFTYKTDNKESEFEEKKEFEKDFPLLPIPFLNEQSTIFFLHIPKSGGWSTFQALNSLMKKIEILKLKKNDSKDNTVSKPASKSKKCRRLDFLWYQAVAFSAKLERRHLCCKIITGHADVSIEYLFFNICSPDGRNLTDSTKGNENENLFPNNNSIKGGHPFLFMMTILREPISRFISSYFYYNERFAMVKMTIWEYLNWTIHRQLDNLETRMLSDATMHSFYPEEQKIAIASMNSSSLLSLAKKNLRKMVMVGLFERFNETMQFVDKRHSVWTGIYPPLTQVFHQRLLH